MNIIDDAIIIQRVGAGNIFENLIIRRPGQMMLFIIAAIIGTEYCLDSFFEI
jgi:hypothetical protein